MIRPVLTVSAASLLMSFFMLGSFSLFDVDEAVFAEATKEMVESGDWITPTYNRENRYDKPILFYWLMGASYKVFGVNEFGARFPSAVSGFLVCMALFLFVRHFMGREQARDSASSLILSFYFLVYTHAAVTDMVLTLFITLALFSFFLSLRAGEGAGRYIYGLYVFSALAFLTKGLIGILFPFCIAVAYSVIAYGLAGPRRVFSPAGILLFFVVSAPWYVAQVMINGDEFIQQFFIKHHFRRYTGVVSGHKGPLYYYFPALIVGLLPWAAFLPGGVRSALRDARGIRGTNNLEPGENPSVKLFALIWLAFIFVFFSLSTTKLPNYILPAVPAASILISSGMEDRDRWRKYANMCIAAGMTAAGVGFLVAERYLLRWGITETGWLLPLSLVSFAMGIACLIPVFTRKPLYGLLSALMIVFLLLLSAKGLPLASRQLQATLLKYSLLAKDRIGKDEKIITFGINRPSIVFYSDRRVVRVGNPDELKSLLQQGGRHLLIAKTREADSFAQWGFNVLERDEQYALLEKQ